MSFFDFLKPGKPSVKKGELASEALAQTRTIMVGESTPEEAWDKALRCPTQLRDPAYIQAAVGRTRDSSPQVATLAFRILTEQREPVFDQSAFENAYSIVSAVDTTERLQSLPLCRAAGDYLLQNLDTIGVGGQNYRNLEILVSSMDQTMDRLPQEAKNRPIWQKRLEYVDRIAEDLVEKKLLSLFEKNPETAPILAEAEAKAIQQHEKADLFALLAYVKDMAKENNRFLYQGKHSRGAQAIIFTLSYEMQRVNRMHLYDAIDMIKNAVKWIAIDQGKFKDPVKGLERGGAGALLQFVASDRTIFSHELRMQAGDLLGRFMTSRFEASEKKP